MQSLRIHTEFFQGFRRHHFDIFFQGFQDFLLHCSTKASSVLDCLHTFLSYERLLFIEFHSEARSSVLT
jgi:hypothetical protein